MRRKLTAMSSRRWSGENALRDRTGTVRRLEGLQAAGWSLTELGREMGVGATSISCFLRTPSERVTRQFADRVAYTYDRCWHRTPPGRYVLRVTRHATRHGYVEPWRWDGVDIDDPAAVPIGDTDELDVVKLERLVAGWPVTFDRREVREVVRRLAARGMSDGEIGLLLGKTNDAVLKIRERWGGIPAGRAATGGRARLRKAA